MHSTRNLNKICDSFCNDITNFKNNNNKILKCAPYKITNTEKSFESCNCLCKDNKQCEECSDDSVSIYSYSSSSSFSSESSDLPSNCKKNNKSHNKKKKADSNIKCNYKSKIVYGEDKYRPKMKYGSYTKNIKHNNSSDSFEEHEVGKSIIFKPKLSNSSDSSEEHKVGKSKLSNSSDSSEEYKKSKSKIFKPKLSNSAIKSKLSQIKYKSSKHVDSENSLPNDTILDTTEESKTFSEISVTTNSKESSKIGSKELSNMSSNKLSKSSKESLKVSSNGSSKTCSKGTDTKCSNISDNKSTNDCNDECDQCNLGKNAHKKTNKFLKLTDTFCRYTSGRNAIPSFSNHGKYVYIVYNINYDCSGNAVAEIFENKGGHLTTKKVLSTSENYPSINGGYASDNFNKFSLLDNDQMSVARIRILDSKFNTLVCKTFDDYYSNGNSFVGGKFIDNGKYVAVSYVYCSNLENHTQKSVLRILRSDTLEQAYEFHFEGNTYSSIKSFKLKNDCGECETFITLLTNNGIFNADKPEAKSMSVLKILKLDSQTNSIKLVDQALLPQLGNYDLVEKNNYVYIAVGTYRADIKRNKSLFTTQSKSLLHDNGDELRIYRFNNKNMELLYSKNLDTCVKVLYHPNKNNILVQQNNLKTDGLLSNEYTESDCGNVNNELINYPGFFNINSNFINNCEIGIGNSCVTRMAPNNFLAEFSRNGKWLIVTGSKENSDELDVYGIKNIQLYHVNLSQ